MAKSKAYSHFPNETGGTLPSKVVSDISFDLGKDFSWLKYGKAPAAAIRAVVSYDMTS